MSDVTSRAWWRWMPGMRDTRGCRLTDRGSWDMPDGWDVAAFAADRYAHHPDETDPATLGCLTQRARDLHNDPGLFARPRIGGPGWVVIGAARVLLIEGPTEYAALLAACDAAPVNTKENP